jgi:transcriptional regulator with XRE-family HTH domain
MPFPAGNEVEMNNGLPATVCLNGLAVRTIREEKRLTQLYVSKVVGVTTDTISRWENNRYPSVKRENAVRLAEALETPVEEILQGGDGRCDPEPAPRKKGVIVGMFLVALFGLLLAVGYFSFYRRPAPLAGKTARRLLPDFAAPGSVIPIRVRVKTGSTMRGFILREHFPRGWKLIESNPPPSSLDNEKGTVRWILKPGASQPLIYYLLRVSPKAPIGKLGRFKGEVVANPDGRNAPSLVGGETRVRIAAYQWADLNGDNVIDDGEILQAYDIVDEMKAVHLNWKLLKSIWDAGGYRWDKKQERFVPARPPVATAEAPRR